MRITKSKRFSSIDISRLLTNKTKTWRLETIKKQGETEKPYE